MYFLLQISIMFAVGASNIAWRWTPNSYLVGLIGVVLALLATIAINQLLTWARKQRRPQRR